MATVSYGAILVPILQEFNPHDIHHIINHSDSVLLFVGDHIWENIEMEKLPEVRLLFLCRFFLPRATRRRGDCQVFAGDETEIQSYLSERFQ